MMPRKLFATAVFFFLAISATLTAGENPAVEQDHPRERAEWNAMFRRDPEGRVMGTNRLKALREASSIPADPSMVPTPQGGQSGFPSVLARRAAATWQSIGPQPILSKVFSDRNYGNVSGRVDAIAIHTTNPSVILLGAATGGIWKSTDSGSTWRPVSDNAPSPAISSIAFAPSNPSIAYAATGELDEANLETSAVGSLGTYLGAGLLKSTDGGETWARSDVNLPPGAILARVLAHPTNPQTVLVAVNRFPNFSGSSYFYGGIYKSTDGGVNFTRTFSHFVMDLAQDPNSPDRVYLGASNFCTGCPDGGVWSSNDFGQTWTKSFTKTTRINEVKLGVSRTNPTALYVSLLDSANAHAGVGGIFKSSDSGGTWSQVNVDPTMCPSTGTNQCDYDHWITVHPTNPSIVYFGSIDIYKSTDGAQTWGRLTQNYLVGRQEPVHGDQHAGVILISSPNTIYFGNDGGVWRTTDGGQTFQNLNSTLDLSQFNTISPHPINSSIAAGGTQDNSDVRYNGSLAWTGITGADGNFVLFRKDNPSQVLATNQWALMKFSSDGGNTISDASPCGVLVDCTASKSLETMAFYPPFAAAPSAPGTVFLGTNRIWVNSTFGQSASAWQARSAAAVTSVSNDFLTAIAPLGDGTGAFWAGSSAGSVLFSSNGGATFASLASGLPTSPVSQIVTASADGRTAYVTFGGFLGAPSRHVFRTTNAGQTWTNVSSNLADAPVLSFAIDPSDPNDLFVGTDVGVFRSTNAGGAWANFSSGLPTVSITGLSFSPATGDLYAATYGRGVFRITPGAGGSPTLTISKNAASSVGSGQNLTYTITYGNSGTAGASGVVISDTVPGGTTFVSATGGGTLNAGAVTWDIGTLNAGGTGQTVTFTVRVTATSGTVTNGTYSIQATGVSPVSGASVSTTVTPAGSPALTISKSAPPSISTGQNLTYTITYGNIGSAAASGVILSDTVPSGTTFVSVANGGIVLGNLVSWSIGTLNAGVTGQTVSFTVAVTATSGTVTNNAYSIQANGVSPVAGSPVSTTVSAGGGGNLPNLTPYQPNGWSDKIIVSRTQGATTDSSSLSTSDTLYTSWAVLNNGGAAAATRFFVDVFVDGAPKATSFFYCDPPLNPNFYCYWQDYSIGSLAAGTHTIRIKADSTGAIAESNENDNDYTKTFTVGGVGAPCVASTGTLCLNNNRFAVTATWQSSTASGAGTAVPIVNDTGTFWFFSPANYEILVKVVNGCGFNNAYWVFAGGLTNVRVTLRVTDTQTGQVKTYENPLNTAFLPIQDTAAIPRCP